MEINYNVEHHRYEDRYRNLDIEAKGVVKSEKFFPVYLKGRKDEIFKPLSKTKPLLTPFFAYSEVFWSTAINRYFDPEAPIYRLAICHGYSDAVPKYDSHGTIVPSILDEDEYLVNLLEYFKENKDPSVNIDEYVNFCMFIYNYTNIFNSRVFSENEELGKKLALQVLLSILRADQNFHYENIAFKFKDGNLVTLASPIDHEFSSMFMHLDNVDMNKAVFDEYKNLLLHEKEGVINKNLDLIVYRYEDVVREFLKSLEVFIYDLEHNPISLKNKNYLYPFNTDNYRAGIALYKNNKPELAHDILSSLKQYVVDVDTVSSLIHEEVLDLAKTLQKCLIEKIEIKHQKTLEY